MKGESHAINIVIAAGGTGGHLYPAVALAREFLRQDAKTGIVFVGTGRGVESKVLEHEGFRLTVIAAQPVMGMNPLKALRGLCTLPMGFWQALKILRANRAGLVIAIGGYASPAVVLAAAALGVPRVLLEPNSYAGMANRVMGPLADRVWLAFDSAASAFPRTKVRVVGMPIRREFIDGQPALSAGGDEHPPVLLIFGGSQGARAVNEAMVQALPHLQNLRERLSVVHQTGEADHERVRAAYQAAGFPAQVVPFLYDMPRQLRSASLVIARSGAMTLAELTVCGTPAILVPLPHAIHDHQTRNANVLESAGAAVVLAQADLSGERLAAVIQDLVSDPTRLSQMSQRSRTLGRTDSAETIVRECLALARHAPSPRPEAPA